MNKDEARSILAEAMQRYRLESYGRLQRLLADQETEEITGDSGVTYHLKFYAYWDENPDTDLRVFGDIDDGGWHRVIPMSEDFIMSPEGKFIGE